jgi:hypothetical protein
MDPLAETMSMSLAAEEAIAAWARLPRINELPSKASFRPAEFKPLLVNMVICELESDSCLRVRLSGTAVNERWGRDLTGANYFELISADDRPAALQRTRRALEQPCAVWSLREERYTNGRKVVLETLTLPFCDDHGTPKFTITINYMAALSWEFDPPTLSSSEVVRSQFVDLRSR